MFCKRKFISIQQSIQQHEIVHTTRKNPYDELILLNFLLKWSILLSNTVSAKKRLFVNVEA